MDESLLTSVQKKMWDRKCRSKSKLSKTKSRRVNRLCQMDKSLLTSVQQKMWDQKC